MATVTYMGAHKLILITVQFIRYVLLLKLTILKYYNNGKQNITKHLR